MTEIVVAHIHDLKNVKNVDAFAANVSLTTSFPGFIRQDGRLNVQLRSLSPSATTNYVVFISGSEFGSEPKSRSLSMQSERVTHLHIETIHKNPMDTHGLTKSTLKSNTVK